jgi:hypothetical protein
VFRDGDWVEAVDAAPIVKLNLWAHTSRAPRRTAFLGRHSVKITVQAASGFPPGPAIGLSLRYSSSWQRSFPTMVRGF